MSVPSQSRKRMSCATSSSSSSPPSKKQNFSTPPPDGKLFDRGSTASSTTMHARSYPSTNGIRILVDTRSLATDGDPKNARHGRRSTALKSHSRHASASQELKNSPKAMVTAAYPRGPRAPSIAPELASYHIVSQGHTFKQPPSSASLGSSLTAASASNAGPTTVRLQKNCAAASLLKTVLGNQTRATIDSATPYELEDENDHDNDAKSESDYSRCVSTIAFPEDQSDIPDADEITVELVPLVRCYEDLHAALCSRQLDGIPRKAKGLIEQLERSIDSVHSASGRIAFTASYTSARNYLLFTKELLVSHYGRVPTDRDVDESLAMGYQLMEMAISSFRNLLQVVEMERSYLEAPPGLDAETPLDIPITRVQILSHPELEKRRANLQVFQEEKQGRWKDAIFMFSRLRKMSFTCRTRLDTLMPPSPVSDFDEDCIRFTMASDLDSLSVDQEPDGDVNPQVILNETYNITGRDSLARFPDPALKSVEPNLPLTPEEEAGVIRSSDGSITAATVPQVLRILTDQREILGRNLYELLDSFFLFFRHFLTPDKLLDLLIARYNQAPPSGLSEEQQYTWRLYHRFARIHVAKLLYLWVGTYWKQTPDIKVLDRIHEFTFETIAKDTELPGDTARLVASGLCDCSSGRYEHYSFLLQVQMGHPKDIVDVYPETIFQPRLDQLKTLRKDDIGLISIRYFCSCGGPQIVARQLTLIESSLFHAFTPEELICHSDYSEIKPKLAKWMRFSNALTLWVISSVVEESCATARAITIEILITVAVLCKSMRNYSSSLAILLGLQSTQVTRMLYTEKLVSNCFRDLRETLRLFFDWGTNWRPYREELARLNLPAIPLVAVFIKDLAHIHDYYPRVKSTAKQLTEDMIPLGYYRATRKIVRGLEESYGLHEIEQDDFLHRWLEHHISRFKEDDYGYHSEALHKQSLSVEPDIVNAEPELSIDPRPAIPRRR